MQRLTGVHVVEVEDARVEFETWCNLTTMRRIVTTDTTYQEQIVILGDVWTRSSRSGQWQHVTITPPTTSAIQRCIGSAFASGPDMVGLSFVGKEPCRTGTCSHIRLSQQLPQNLGGRGHTQYDGWIDGPSNLLVSEIDLNNDGTQATSTYDEFDESFAIRAPAG